MVQDDGKLNKWLRNAKKGHFGTIDDSEFVRLFFIVLSYRITPRQMKYLIWKFYWNLTDNKIAKLDGRRLTRAAINLVLNDAYRKIKHDNSK